MLYSLPYPQIASQVAFIRPTQVDHIINMSEQEGTLRLYNTTVLAMHFSCIVVVVVTVEAGTN